MIEYGSKHTNVFHKQISVTAGFKTKKKEEEAFLQCPVLQGLLRFTTFTAMKWNMHSNQIINKINTNTMNRKTTTKHWTRNKIKIALVKSKMNYEKYITKDYFSTCASTNWKEKKSEKYYFMWTSNSVMRTTEYLFVHSELPTPTESATNQL